MYDFTHCLSDALEGITHSICTLEFEGNRALYDWVLDNVTTPCHPQQIEFARLNLSYTVLSKRKLIQLVDEGCVAGWDDPRMPTIAGLRRRGYTPEAVRDFCDRIGVARNDSVVDMGLLEHCVRGDLNRRARRVMAVLRPLRVVIENFPEGRVEELEGPYHPDDPTMGARKIPFSRVIYIERDDFREDPPRKFFRLAPGREVRLRYGYFIRCASVVRDEKTGEVAEVRCTYDPETRSGFAPDGRKVKGTIHWVPAEGSVEAEVRLYDRLFLAENPNEGPDFKAHLNPDSLEVLRSARAEPSLAQASAGELFQFERLGYFFADPVDFSRDRPVFSRTVTLRDSWAKIEKEG
jgi:glutaminyl-tRNA synthetase